MTAAKLQEHAAKVKYGKSFMDSRKDLDYSVRVQIEVDNVSKWTLTNPKVYTHGGVISSKPQAVAPNHKEYMIARKTGHTATGSYGTVAWDVEDRLTLVMWSEPYNFNHHVNTLAIAIVKPHEYTSDTCDDLYYDKTSFTPMAKAEYYHSHRTLFVCDDVICIRGIMDTSHKPTVNIIVGPASEENFASSAQKPNTYSFYLFFGVCVLLLLLTSNVVLYSLFNIGPVTPVITLKKSLSTLFSNMNCPCTQF